MTLKELEAAAKADAKRKRAGLSRVGYAAYRLPDGVLVIRYYPDCSRFAYFIEGRRVNKRDAAEVRP